MSAVLVIGATGTTGRHIVNGLLDRGENVRALVRSPLTAGLPEPVTVVEGIIEDREVLAAAATGADSAFLLWPTWDEEHVNDVVSVLAAHVGHIVYLSAARLQGGEEGAMDGIYPRVEAAIRAAGVTWTFVRGGGFAANTLEWAKQIRSGDVVRTPFPDAARPLVHELDLADVAVRGLLDADMAGRAFDVTGAEVLTQREQVGAIGAALGRELRVETQPLEEARADYTTMMGAEFADTALAHRATLVEAPERVADGVHQALGRPPRPFAEWARDHVEDFAQRTNAEVAQAYADALGRAVRRYGFSTRCAPATILSAPTLLCRPIVDRGAAPPESGHVGSASTRPMLP